jgi:1-acyl-sn-glycerol-3-phosphate acyltransferase
LLLCQKNTGLVLVEKGNKHNNNNAKFDMINLLLNGHSITYFPEGTWNLSPNKLHLPLSYGFLDTAQKANVPVIPAVNEYTYDNSNGKSVITKIHTRYGKPIYISENDDIFEKLEEYKEAISTIKYELMEEKGIFSRKETSTEEYKTFLKESYKNLKLGKLNWEKETKNIFGASDEFYDFHYINDVPYDAQGNMIDKPETHKLKQIVKKHNL